MTDEIKVKLARGDYKIVENDSSRATSDIWKKFGLIADEENNIISGYAGCKACCKVFAFDSKKLGTSSLRKHVDSCKRSTESVAASSSIDRFFSKSLSTPRREDKEAIAQLAVKFVSRDIRSFETVSGVGFLELAQGLIDVGARAGSVDAQQLLPDPTTVSRRLKKCAEDTRQSITPELRSQMTDSNGAVTLDFWTDDFRKVGYLCVTVHYINRNWELKERVLCTAEWDSTLRKTADNIRPALMNSLRKFGLEEFFSKLVYVTDKGANIVAALRTVTRLNCAAHNLNTVLQNTLGKHTEEDLFGEEVSGLIESAKSLVTYFKQSHLQSRLEKTLKASVETRWNSLHTMLDSISSQYEAIRTLLEERGEEDRLTSISTETLHDIVAFLVRFKEATKALEASKTPTIHLTAVWLERLRRHLQQCSTDSMTLSSLKEKCLKVLDDKFQLHPLHKLAMFLHPKLKSLKLLSSEADITGVHSEARRLVEGKCCYSGIFYIYERIITLIRFILVSIFNRTP